MNSHPVPPHVHPADIVALFGTDTAARGKEYSLQNRVEDADWGPEEDTVVGSVHGNSDLPYEVLIHLREIDRDRRITHYRPVASRCTCPVGIACKHGAALLYTLSQIALQMAASAISVPVGPKVPEWKTVLERFHYSAVEQAPVLPLGIGFDLLVDEPQSWYAPRELRQATLADYRDGSRLLLVMRPLTKGKRGTWIKGGLQWRTLGQPMVQKNYDAQQADLMAQFHTQFTARSIGFDTGGPDIRLKSFSSTFLWHLFTRAQELGIEFVGQGIVGQVRIGERATVTLTLAKDSGDLHVVPTVAVDGRMVPVTDTHPPLPVGNVGFALTSLDTSGRLPHVDIALAPTDKPLAPPVRELFGRQDPLVVPPEDIAEFYEQTVPVVRSVIPIDAADDSIEVPRYRPPQLHLHAEFEAGDRVVLSWDWEYHDPDRTLDLIDFYEFSSRGARTGRRDREFEAATLRQVREVWPDAARWSSTELTGIDTAQFSEQILPRIEELETVRVEVSGDRPDYTELTGAPHVRITTAESTRTDWFDLGILVTIDGKQIPFGRLFEALAGGAKTLLLPDGSFFSLDRPEFDPLREVLAQADALPEWDPEQPRITRYQAGLYAEFEDIADEVDAAMAWRDAVTGLMDVDTVPEVPVPAAVHAELRAYQVTGFRWLAFLHRHRLGGILADDMGLGKTLQTLAFIAHARGFGGDAHLSALPTGGSAGGSNGSELPAGPADATPEPDDGALSGEIVLPGGRQAGASGGTALDGSALSETALSGELVGDAPFLVVAPTSVVSTWKAEAERFVPDLDVRVLRATSKKRKTTIAQEVGGADLVITSYAILRIDGQEFAELPWAGLILDEAQFVKNRSSRVHQAAKNVPAPFRFAITGTPMENSLADLWSLLAIAAPGLFPSFARFNAEYIKPIDSGNAPGRMVQLRKRIRPFMLRRTKELVASDLPEKQEHTTVVELAPKHRKLYDTVLQRERKKLLGLIKDMDRNRFIVFRSLTLLRMLALDPAIVDAEEYGDIPSSKLDGLLDNLGEVVAEGHRVIVFSQFTSFLARVAARLDEAGIDHAYLDGATRDRDGAISGFKEGSAPVFLISLKAGGFGLTLTEADYVFLLDPWWNPAAEAQAIDRTHRIGQTKNVMVYRMVSENTIEEKVLALQRKKAELFTALMDNGSAFSEALTADDVRDLLDG
ncbi:SNF2 domain-containing protein/helicase-like protein/SWIM zinc finger [Brevibacterium pityocampae]